MARIERLLMEGMAQQTASHPDAVLMLSGGIDSGILAALCNNHRTELPVTQAVTVRFEQSEYDEAPLTRLTAAATHLHLTERTMTAREVMALLPVLMKNADMPFADSSLPAFYGACSSGLSSTYITGDGADEYFGGYRRYRAMALRDKWRVFSWLQPLFRLLSSRLPRPADNRSNYANFFRAIDNLSLPAEQAYLAFQSLSSPETLRHLLPALPVFGQLQDICRTLRGRPSAIPWYNRFDLQCYLPFDGRRKALLGAQTAHITLISPFLDERVATLALQLPSALRFTCKETKVILKSIARRYLPKEVYEADKRGFGVPIASWFRQEWRADIQKVVLSLPDWDATGQLHPQEARRITDEHIAGKANHAPMLWAILCLHHWLASHPHASFPVHP